MATEKTEPNGQKTTIEDFRAAVRFLLVNDHGMPDLVADDVLLADENYVQEAFEEGGKNGATVAAVAEELSIKPRENREWIKVDDGQLVVTISTRADELLNRLLSTGLYGNTVADVAAAMLCRGIEAVLPVLPHASPPLRR
ncbi:hypothetical protein [Ralstonia pseudosolanacearum]|uniref:hypothetical protein n=1 Tax=Ralstonia pseudosolanacearum TaxID=1310165 RepID=UPI003CF4C317